MESPVSKAVSSSFGCWLYNIKKLKNVIVVLTMLHVAFELHVTKNMTCVLKMWLWYVPVVCELLVIGLLLGRFGLGGVFLQVERDIFCKIALKVKVFQCFVGNKNEERKPYCSFENRTEKNPVLIFLSKQYFKKQQRFVQFVLFVGKERKNQSTSSGYWPKAVPSIYVYFVRVRSGQGKLEKSEKIRKCVPVTIKSGNIDYSTIVKESQGIWRFLGRKSKFITLSFEAEKINWNDNHRVTIDELWS